MIRHHGYYTVPCLGATCDLMVHASEWTGKSVPELMPLLAGASPGSSGWVPEADQLAAAIPGDAGAAALLDSDEKPSEILDRLRAWEGELGAAVRRWLLIVGHRVVGGYDITESVALDHPLLLLESLRQIVREGRHDDSAIEEAAAAEIREQLPAEQRETFDGMVDDARATYYLRDERGLYCDIWASGVLQRAILDAGRRAVEIGGAHEARHLLEWLSPPVRRSAAATFAIIGQVFDEPDADALARDHHQERGTIRGRAACSGAYEGTARLIQGPHELERIQQGDVLVTPSTSPSFTGVLPRIGAIVTDHGGVLSHAAIVPREYGLPAVVGCQIAMCTIPDGARIRVDADADEVTILG